MDTEHIKGDIQKIKGDIQKIEEWVPTVNSGLMPPKIKLSSPRP